MILTEKNQLETAAERDAVTKPTVVSGLGYPAERHESSPEPTGWQASGPHSTAAGSNGTFEKVSRGTSE